MSEPFRIVCASDGHGARFAREELMRVLPPCDLFCWLGDTENDALFFRAALAQTRPQTRFEAVAGNCDPFSPLPLTVRENAAGLRIFITHGHLFGVKLSPDALAEAAWANGCALALFGHTHAPCRQGLAGVTLFNPGALRDGCWGYAQIGAEGEICTELRSLGRAE